MTEYSIREATIDDVKRFKQFLIKAWREAGPNALGWSGASDDQIEEIVSDNFLSSLITREGTRIFLAYTQDEVIGFATNTKVNDEAIELSGIIVLENMTRQGVGTALLQSAISRAKSDGTSYLVVQTEQKNKRAIQFYQTHGFHFKKETTMTINEHLLELARLELTIK